MEEPLLQFVHLALQNTSNDKEMFKFELLDDDTVNRILGISGHLLSDYRRVMDTFAVRHIFKNHGDEARESQRGQIAVLPEDFVLISALLTQYESFSVERNRIGNIMFRYTMEADGFRLVYAEEVRTGRRELAVQTL